jgi:hypothetical protein
MTIKYQKFGLAMAEQWLDDAPGRPDGCDVLLLYQYADHVQSPFSEPFDSLVIDLRLEESALLEGLNRDTKYKFRRAQTKDAVICVQESASGHDQVERFLSFYDEFAVGKGLQSLRREVVQARAAAGVLRFSRAEYEGRTVVWHVHVVANGRASLLYSASHFRGEDDKETRAAIGRANRLLHWDDMLSCKSAGITHYDFGGWYAGQTDEALLNINRFKEGFGGVRVTQRQHVIALTWRGWLFVQLRRLKAWTDSWRRPRSRPSIGPLPGSMRT